MTSITKLCASAALGAAMVAVPAMAKSVDVDYKNPAELTGYRTYNIQSIYATSPAVEARLDAAIVRDLDRKGWHEVADNPKVAVAAVLSTDNGTQQYSAFYNGIGNLHWNVAAPGESPDSVANSPAGTLVVDMYDTSTGQLIWRSSAQDLLSSSTDKEEIKVDNTVDKMLNRLPWDDSPNPLNGLNAIPE